MYRGLRRGLAYAGGMDPDPSVAPGGRPEQAGTAPLLALLGALALLLSGLVVQRRSQPSPTPRVGLQGRVAELPAAAEALFGAALKARGAAPEMSEPWDRALAGVLAAERGDLEAGARLARAGALPGPAGEAFARCWDRAYGDGPAPTPAQRDQVRGALGDGWAAGLLETRLEARDGRDGAAARRRAGDRVLRRLAAASLLGLGAGLAALAGLGVGVALLLRRTRPPLPPAPQVPGRILALALLGWYLGLLLSGTVVSPVVQALPFLRPYALSLNVGLHAGWGLLLLRGALGPGWGGLGRSLWAGPPGRALAWGLAHLALAVPLVLAVAWAVGPLVRRFPTPQRELVDALAGLQGAGPLLAAGLTVAVAAPLFEEVLFRGVLLPALARRWGWTWGVVGSGLLFGAIHLQPAGLPTLATLGMVLALAYRAGGSLLAPVLVHALWNGAIFLFLRTLAG